MVTKRNNQWGKVRVFRWWSLRWLNELVAVYLRSVLNIRRFHEMGMHFGRKGAESSHEMHSLRHEDMQGSLERGQAIPAGIEPHADLYSKGQVNSAEA